MLGDLVDGGIDEFKEMNKKNQETHRRRAIEYIRDQCKKEDKVGVVTGHFMFWEEGNSKGMMAWTADDAKIYTHVLYLDTAPALLAQRSEDDKERDRASLSINHLRKWQEEEQSRLRQQCRENGILFFVVTSDSLLCSRAVELLRDFQFYDETYNLSHAETKLDAIINHQGRLKTCLVLDADGTLAADDTGHNFWETASKSQALADGATTLTKLFNGLGHSYIAFRQAMLLYEESFPDPKFENLCQKVASNVKMYSEFSNLLKKIPRHKHVGAVVVTCGLRRVWELILKREGLSDTVKVVGGTRLSDGFVVTPAVKEALVKRLQHTHQLNVWAFGDSPSDMGMLKKANYAVVVVGEGQYRSNSMEEELEKEISAHRLVNARQALLPGTAPHRLDLEKLPTADLTAQSFLDSVMSRQPYAPRITNAEDHGLNASKLIATAMRDAATSGPALRKAHRRAGYYLAIQYLTDIIGIEKKAIKHVQGGPAHGSRLSNEPKTTIIALMRGGEPMASGVNEAFPTARFAHVDEAKNIDGAKHLDGQETVILVDSVINTGETIAKCIQRIRNELKSSISIVVVAGVTQAKCIRGTGDGSKNALQEAAHSHDFELITLRSSETSFVGTYTNDTGNRLFNTTHLR